MNPTLYFSCETVIHFIHKAAYTSPEGERQRWSDGLLILRDQLNKER